MGKALHGYNSNALCGLEHPEKVNSRLISIVNCRRLGLIEFNKEIQKLVALLSKTDCPPSTTLSDSARVVDAEHPSIFGLG
jgi:hypothetical protein